MEINVQSARSLRSVWRQLLNGNASINRRIFQSSVLIAVLTLLVRVVGLGREMAIAAHFGTSDDIDAYLMAFLLPNFVVNVLAGSINAAFIPTFVTVREQHGQAAADRLLGSVLLATIGLLLLTTVIILAGAPTILALLAPGFASAKLALTVQLYYWLSPVIVLQGIITIWSSVLNADEEFALAAFLPAIATLAALLFLLLGVGSFGIYSLVVGFLVGFGLQALVLGWRISRKGYSLALRWDGWTPELKQVLLQYLPMIAGAFLLSGTGLVEQFMAASLPPGSVASLGYAARLTGVANGICAMALGTAVLPHFSAMVARGDFEPLRHTLKTYRWLIFLVGGLTAAVLIMTSPLVVGLLFQRGQFTSEDTRVIAGLQRWYAVQLPFYAGGIFLVRLISALHANKFLMWGSLISLLVSIGLNLLLIPRLGLGGVALANSLMYIISFVYLSAVISWLMRRSVFHQS